MNNKLICPFCNETLQPTLRQSDEYWCENYDCPRTNIEWVGSQKLWQELIRTRKELEQSETCCTEWEKQALDYKAENIALSGELERTRKALDVAVDALKEIDKTRSVANHKIGTQDKTLNSGIVFCWATPDEIHNTLEQIKAEKKDK